GNVLAFFEIPNSPTMGRDENTPTWVQHIALEVEDVDALVAAKEELQSKGVDVLGPVHHGVFKSIYFFDPSGHRLELAANTGTVEQMKELKRVAPLMIEEWAVTKVAPKHAAWLHE
ncbi:MAG: catechol-2,3-dioxygenase, partial [Colwellia sp.]